MKVRWLLRPQAKPGISIEKVFDDLRPFFPSEIQIEVCKLPGTGNLKTDVNLHRKFIKNLPEVDLTHVLGDVHYTTAWIKGKQVHTYHDIDSLLKGNIIAQKLKQYAWLKHPIKQAVGISCISSYTANRIKEIIPTAQHKIKVIYNALSPSFSFKNNEGEPARLILRQAQYDKACSVKNGVCDNVTEESVISSMAGYEQTPFKILSLGTKANKNLLRCADALKGIADLEWHIVGKLPDVLKVAIADNKLKVINHLNLNEEALITLYQEVELLLFPSLYEGFGLPIIEAQACGTAVITSNCTSMPEVAGEGALLVNPNRVDEIRVAVLRLIDDTVLCEKLIEYGRENIKRFQIRDIAQQYASWYKSVINQDN